VAGEARGRAREGRVLTSPDGWMRALRVKLYNTQRRPYARLPRIVLHEEGELL
jgi:hypothetical protein